MQETKDPAIKLFGMKIPLQGAGDDPNISGDNSVSAVAVNVEEEEGGGDEEDDGGQKRPEDEEENEPDKESQSKKVTESPEEKEAEQLPDSIVNPKALLLDEETIKSSKNDNGTNSQEKTLKKPDQVLPCPRCNSMDTKFCYYNNYNINQPRHFCKSCQRYWTAGGTMRNVPVGAGRRKSKNNYSHYRHITISEALHAARIDAPNGKILSFGLDATIYAPMASVLNLAENNVVSKSTRNGFHNHILENQRGTSSIKESGKNTLQIPYLPDVSWSYPPGFPPLSFHHPAAFWNHGVSSEWNLNLPWFSSNSSLPTLKSPKSGSNSPTLGKHTRDGDIIKPGLLQKEEPWKQRNGSVLVPKTLRIDDPSEAAMSSIWATLGIENESLSGGGMFEAIQSRKDGKKNQKHHGVETPSVLRANPAALCRSVNFHENT